MNLFINIPISVYNRNLYISIGQTDDVLYSTLDFECGRITKKDRNALVINPSNDGKGGIISTGDGIIRLEKYDDADPYLRNVMAHEIFHVVFNMLADVGLKPNQSSDEAYAYLIGYIHQEFLKSFIAISQKPQISAFS